jgi:hypothetical protein
MVSDFNASTYLFLRKRAQIEQPAAQRFFPAVAPGRRGQMHPPAIRQLPQRLHEGQPFVFHHKPKHVAVLFAPEAVEILPVPVHGKRRRAILVEWTEAGHPAAAGRFELHDTADHIDDIVGSTHLLDNFLGVSAQDAPANPARANTYREDRQGFDFACP